MTIDCAFYGFLAADAEPRVSQAGKPWVRLRVGVGKDDNVQWVSVAVFGKAAAMAATLEKGDRIYCEGTLRLDVWVGKDGVEKHGLSVAAFKIDRTHAIGRNKPKDQPSREQPLTRQDFGAAVPFDDQIPFAPEWRG